MARANFAASLRVSLMCEGGYVDDPYDPGGATNMGITQCVYDVFRKERRLPIRPVSEIADEEVSAIYRAQYWDAVDADNLPRGLDCAVFDYAVNSGSEKAVKDLQRVLGVRVDGHVCMVTLAAANSSETMKAIEALCDMRMAFLKSLRTWRWFGEGWSRRVETVRACAEAMAQSSATVQPTTCSMPDPTPKAKPGTISAVKTRQGKVSIATLASVLATAALAIVSEFSPFSHALAVIKWIVILLTILGAAACVFEAIENVRAGKEA